ncbi:benzoate/H(+) symporter BenE family transporter [Alteromonas sp. H39]|uniref:benzoate/H(+) symporter BenE family transporter n=1 Tax=Alteromonas sp. H39 TaxID=3389876 RepID=UPI0039E1C8B9
MSAYRLSHISAGLAAVVVGYSSAVVLVIDAARQAGATPPMVISWLLALGLGMGVSCILFSWWYKMPVVTAWSTPGAAFLIGAAGEYTLPEVIGSFIVSAVFSIVVSQSKVLSKAIGRIPSAIASAMLAGILLPICLGVFSDAAVYPVHTVLFLAVYLLGSVFFPRYMMLTLLLLACVTSIVMGVPDDINWTAPTPVWVTPAFSLSATIGLALPLFIITLLTQNLPGIAIHRAHGYSPDHKSVLSGLGVIQLILAPFGGFTFNLAAITAALCMGEDVDSKPGQRYRAAIVAGVGYLIMGAMASLVVVVFLSMPTVVVHLLAGLALLATFQASVVRAIEAPEYRQAATLTLVCSASGITLAQLTAPVWGLALGLLVMMMGASPFRRRQNG